MEIIGSREKAVAIIDLNEKVDLDSLLKNNKNIKVVLKKISGREDEFRIPKYEIVYGNDNCEVIHKEYGYSIKVDVTKAYFSSKEATERQRLANLTKDNEEILLMFSGVAPIAIAIAKRKNVKIYCIEINKAAHEYAKENVKINKVEDKVFLFNGDVREVCNNELKDKKFDRIIMPIIFSINYLDLAVKKLKKNGFVHFYHVCEENVLEEIAKKFNLKIVNIQKVSEYAPRKIKYRVDAILIYE